MSCMMVFTPLCKGTCAHACLGTCVRASFKVIGTRTCMCEPYIRCGACMHTPARLSDSRHDACTRRKRASWGQQVFKSGLMAACVMGIIVVCIFLAVSPIVMLGRVFGKSMSMAYGAVLGVCFQASALCHGTCLKGRGSNSGASCRLHVHYDKFVCALHIIPIDFFSLCCGPTLGPGHQAVCSRSCVY